MTHFFIDTNVLLSFYAFTQDDLARLELLAGQVEAGSFKILTTQHVQNEVVRNRGAKIAEARKEFQGQRLDARFPRLVDPYEETAELRRLAGEYSKLHRQLLAQVDEDAKQQTLRADHLIARFFDGATSLDVSKEAIERARLRMELGHPPGKRGSLGDAVNWELVLEYKPDDLLFFVTDDKHFYSHLGTDEPHEFLVAEWGKVVGSPIAFRRRLSQLPEESVPQDVLPVDDAPPDQATELAELLVETSNFAQTHALIAALGHTRQYTPRQVALLVSALTNSQVSWIITDEDVFSFYSLLLQTHAPLMTSEDAVFLNHVLDEAAQVRDELDDPPFYGPAARG